MKLIPLTKKGKDRIARWGSEWQVIGEDHNHWFIVSIKDQSTDTKDSSRWIAKQDDPNFKIVPNC